MSIRYKQHKSPKALLNLDHSSSVSDCSSRNEKTRQKSNDAITIHQYEFRMNLQDDLPPTVLPFNDTFIHSFNSISPTSISKPNNQIPKPKYQNSIPWVLAFRYQTTYLLNPLPSLSSFSLSKKEKRERTWTSFLLFSSKIEIIMWLTFRLIELNNVFLSYKCQY